MTRPIARLPSPWAAAAAVATAAALAACGGSAATQTRTVTRTATPTTQPGSESSSSAPATTSTTSSAPSTNPSASSSAARPAPCVAAGLALSFIGGQGATGHGELGFALRNTGARACRTVGYPGVQFLDGAGRPLPTRPTHTTSDFFGTTAYRPLVLAAGATASFRLGVSHGAGSQAGCTTAHALQVIAPNDTATLRVALPNGGAYECGAVTVSPLQPGTSAYH